MLIGLIGAHRTGKTTLAKAYSSEIGGQFLETKSADVFKRHGVRADVDMDFDTRLKVQEDILNDAQEVWAQSDDSTTSITDRTPLDMLAYTLSWLPKGVLPNDQRLRLEAYANRCFSALSAYFELVVLIPPAIPLEKTLFKGLHCQSHIDQLHYIMCGLLADERVSCTRFQLKKKVTALQDRIEAVLRAELSVHQRLMQAQETHSQALH